MMNEIGLLCARLTQLGCAICVFTPEELGSAPAEKVEDAMCSSGRDAIEFWKACDDRP